MQRQTETAAFRRAVDGKIEGRCTLDDAVRDALNLAGVLFKDEKITITDEGHTRRLRKTADNRLYREVGIGHRRPARRSFDDRLQTRRVIELAGIGFHRGD